MKTPVLDSTDILDRKKSLKHDIPTLSQVLNSEETLAVCYQTVPASRNRNIVSFPELEIADLRQAARNRSSIVSVTPRLSESGQYGFTPHQQFIIAASMLITSTFTVAYAVSYLLP